MTLPRDPRPPVPAGPTPGPPAPADARDADPAWRRETLPEHRGPVLLAVVVAITLQLTLPRRLSLPPRELMPALELLVLAGLTVANPLRMVREHPLIRLGGLVLVGLLSAANAVSAALLADRLVTGHAHTGARSLLLAGTNVYLTNIIAFSLWYWEYDRGGPAQRRHGTRRYPDLMFPQMASPDLAPRDWEPRYLDYLYLSFTNSTAFSPTDTLPMSLTAKLLMGVQSAVALVTVALVVARAVNVLQ